MYDPALFGSHLSIAGSIVNALHEAERLGFDTVQIFTKNQQQWRARPLDPAVVADWRVQVKRLGWERRTVSHASYLINLASPDDVLWRRSIDLMTDEIERCETLGIPLLVHHPGAYTTSSHEAGVARIGAAYREVFTRTRGFSTVSCLEGTVGCGSIMGRTFEELAQLRAAIIDHTGEPSRIGYCLDTCHMHAGGYDLATRAGADAAFDAFHRACGLPNLRVLHVNDSKSPVGSRLDRHAHIGEGTIGRGRLESTGFRAVVNRAELKGIPKILETPKGTTPGGTPYDTLNLRRLKRLVDGEPINYRPHRSGRPHRAPGKVRSTEATRR